MLIYVFSVWKQVDHLWLDDSTAKFTALVCSSLGTVETASTVISDLFASVLFIISDMMLSYFCETATPRLDNLGL